MARYNGRIIVGVGGKQQQADWNETDSNSPSYIKNKPNIDAGLHYEVVNTLPTEDIDTNCVYLVPSSDPHQGDVYDEYMYIDNAWEKIGSTGMAQVQSDWAESDPTSPAYIDNKPNLATVATSGDYTDLSNTPSLATVATTGDYDDLTNKPTIPTVNDATITIQQNGSTVGTFTTNDATDQTINLTGGSNDWFGTQEEFDALGTYDEDTNYHIQQELATVAFTGDYDDLSNKPTIPTQVQADWSQSDNTAPDYIKYKPPLPQTSTLETSATPVLDVEDSVIITCTTPVTSLTINRVGGGQYESNVYFTTGNTPFTMTVPNSLDGIVGSTSLQANTDYIVCIKDNRMVISYNGYTGGVTVNNNAPTLAYGQTSTVGTVDGTNLTVTMPAAPSVPTRTSQLTNDGDTGSGSIYVLDTDLPTQTSELLNDGDGNGNTYVLNTDLQSGGLYPIPTATSELLNDGDGNNNIYVLDTDLAAVAFSGDYSDLTNTPTIPTVPSNLVTGVNASGVDTALTLRKISQADYDALVQAGTVDPNTVYMIS